MTRDYRGAEVFSPGTRPLPLWLWLFAVLAVSGFVSLIYYLDKYEKSKSMTQNNEASAPANSALKAGKDGTKDSGDAGTQFDFYKLLPKISVDVPKTDIEERHHSTLPVPEKKSSAPTFSYILQVGSFKDYHEADRLKAKLAFLGIEVKIEKVILNDADIWHRVRIGPIQSEREMNKIRSQLRSQQIEPIMLKVKA